MRCFAVFCANPRDICFTVHCKIKIKAKRFSIRRAAIFCGKEEITAMAAVMLRIAATWAGVESPTKRVP